MEREKREWNEKVKKRVTESNWFRIKDMKKFIEEYDSDPKKEKRKQNQTCRTCSYRQTIAMQAFTYTNCGKCDKEIMKENSNVDILCQDCATETKSCKHCGGEMD